MNYFYSKFLFFYQPTQVHLFLLIQLIVFVLEFILQSVKQILIQNPIQYVKIIKGIIIYQFLLNLLFLCLFLIFVFLSHFEILVMLQVKNTVLIFTHSSLVLSQIPLHNFLFVSPNSQALRLLLLLNHPSQFLQQNTIIFFLQFLMSLNLTIQNLLVRLLEHLNKVQQASFPVFYSNLSMNFFPKSEGV